MDTKAFGKRLKALRKERDLTLESLAVSISSHKGVISRWENGLMKPDIDSFEKMLTFFNVSRDFMLGKTGSRHSTDFVAKQTTYTCPYCDSGIERSFKFCPSCGHSITKLCANGHRNALTAQYCTECGISLNRNREGE